MITKDRAIKILAGVSIGLLVIGGGIAYKGYKDMNDPQLVIANRIEADDDILTYTDSIQEHNMDISILAGFVGDPIEDATEYKIIICIDQPAYIIDSDSNYETLCNKCRNYAEEKLREHHVRKVKVKIVLRDENFDDVYEEE